MSRNRIGEYPGRGRNVRAGPDESSQRGSGDGDGDGDGDSDSDGQPEVSQSQRPDGDPSMGALLRPRQFVHARIGSSVVDGFDAELLRSCVGVLHRLEDIGGVSLPVCELACDQERVA